MNIAQLPASSIAAVFCDLDDTLTDDGQISPGTYEALWRLKEQGFWLVIVSGRPAGWADALMRLWPIDHMIFENGAGILGREGKKIRPRYLAKESGDRPRLEAIFSDLKAEFPSIKTATDQFCRLFDYTIDCFEAPPYLDTQTVEKILWRLGAVPGLTVKLSSIHINFWFGQYTKVTACRDLLLREASHRQISNDRVVFVGDSPNDEPLFEFFPNAVGVANVACFLGKMKFKPKYLTNHKGGNGFQEVVSHLLSARGCIA